MLYETSWRRGFALWLALTASACTGSISEEPAPYGAAPGQPSSPVGAANASGSSSNSANKPNGQAGAGASSGSNAQPRDVGRVDLHRLNNTEYDNTVRDLLGVTSTPARSFIADEKAFGFDSIAAALGMTDAQYEQYFNAADELVERTFADAALRKRIVTCAPAANADPNVCTRQIVTSFGLRAWRRPLDTAEADALVAVAQDARGLGENFDAAIAQVAKAMLSAPAFLYRVELDADPNAKTAHALNGYELASRVSYLVWSTLPDQRLFDLAKDNTLADDATLDKELDRMLADPRAENFSSSFAGQWLGLRDLKSHQVEPTVFPQWNEALRTAMIREGQLYFDEFLHGRRSIDEFFTAPVNFVDAELAKLYGIGAPSGTGPAQRVTNATKERQGFLGLASFLTMTSFSYRTAPTLRGKWVLENLLCEGVAPPPADVPKLDEAASGGDLSQLNVRERLAEHRKNPACAGCHTVLDPIGLGLENFDAIGEHRSEYSQGDPVDASGMLPNGGSFNGLIELAGILARDTRLQDCASEKLMTYALSRELVASDGVYLAELRAAWPQTDKSLLSLLRLVVHSDPFQQRRGEVVP
ncbi:MAG: hypothetical protein RL701_1093 [Pseudomonadota bacterium]|jgi:hypothetical protein